MNGDLNGTKSPKSAKRTANKGTMQVALLDDTVVAFDVEPRLKGEELYKKVNTHLNLDEAEFFGLLFVDDDNIQSWLVPSKPIIKQVRDPSNITFKFRVMFYTPDPNSLQEYTRYLFTLQVRRDLLDGRLHCSEDTGALLASYIVQGELGDHDPMNHKEGYLEGFQFVPNQTSEIEQKIVDYHKAHRGETPAESDHNMLEIARQLEMYGITLYPAQDGDNAELNLAVYHMGILVFQDKHKINTFSWAKVRKMSFKKKKFLVKLHIGTGQHTQVVSFNLASRNAAKGFWKVCVNHHVFFRHRTAAPSKKGRGSFKRGSKYRYSGRTKKEITAEAAARYRSASEIENDKSRSRLSGSIPKGITPSTSSVPDSPLSDGPLKYHNRHVSEDEGSFSIASEQNLYKKEPQNGELEEDNLVTISTHLTQQNVITMTHQETFDTINSTEESIDLKSSPPSYNEVMNNDFCVPVRVQPTESTPLTFEFDDSKFSLTMPIAKSEGDGDDLSLDASVHVTNTDRELEDEVDSMFKRINSEYGAAPPGWQYNISSITTDELKSDNEKDEHSDTEDKMADIATSECTEADADEERRKENSEHAELLHSTSDRTEADEETEVQLREKVKGFSYLEYQAQIEVS